MTPSSPAPVPEMPCHLCGDPGSRSGSRTAPPTCARCRAVAVALLAAAADLVAAMAAEHGAILLAD